MILWKLAFRNLRRNRRRTLLTLAAMVASSSLLILSLGVFSGMFVDMLASVTEQYSGHMVVAGKGYLDRREMHATMDQAQAVTEQASRLETFRGASPRLRSFGLLSLGDRTQPAEVLGIDPTREIQVTQLHRKLVDGRYLDPDEDHGIVLGVGLARKLRAEIGSELVFVTQAADGSIGNDLMTVRGLFDTGSVANDNGLALVPLHWLQETIALPDQLHEVAITLKDPLQAKPTAAVLAGRLDDRLEVRDWGQMLPEMAEVIASYGASTLILSMILYAAAGLGIVNTLYMSVMERTQEFGVLLAMGLHPAQVRRLVLLESTVLGVLAMVLGATLGFFLTLWMKTVGIDLSGSISSITYAGGTILPRLHAEFEFRNFWLPSLLLLVTAVLAGWLPARRAARLQPVEALRED